jgi:hypothetical protein
MLGFSYHDDVGKDIESVSIWVGRIGLHSLKSNAFGHGVVQTDGKLSKGADFWYFAFTAGNSSLKNHLQNRSIDDLDIMTLGLAMSKLRGQYNDRCLGG